MHSTDQYSESLDGLPHRCCRATPPIIQLTFKGGVLGIGRLLVG